MDESSSDEIVLELRRLGKIADELESLNVRVEALEDAVTSAAQTLYEGLDRIERAIRSEPRLES